MKIKPERATAIGQPEAHTAVRPAGGAGPTPASQRGPQGFLPPESHHWRAPELTPAPLHDAQRRSGLGSLDSRPDGP